MNGAKDFVPLTLSLNGLHHLLSYLKLAGHQRQLCLGVWYQNDFQGKP